MKKLRIYVAGPYTKGDVAMNVRAAIFEGNYIRNKLGHIPFIPHLTHFWHMLIPHDINFWYAYDIEWLKQCDAILRMDGESKGADREVEIAKELGLTVYTNLFDIPKAEEA